MLSLISATGFSQSRIGGLVQEEGGKPLPFATVLLLSARDSSLVKGAITTQAGEYVVENVGQGSYLVAVTMMGYQKIYSASFAISETKENLILPILVTHSQTQELAQVTVTAQKPPFEQKLDRLVVNVQSSISAAGATALDILERSPGIGLNRQNNSLSMNGKEGVVIMINGKITRLPMDALLQMLSGMNAGNIEKMELIPTPSASYDAEGNAGVINIVLKKNTDIGTNGNYSLTMGYGWYERPAASLNLNHRRQKLNLFIDGSFLWNHYWFSTYTNRIISYQNQLLESNNLSNRNSRHMTYNARLGFDYSIGAHTNLSGLISGFNNKQDQFARNNASMYTSGELTTTIAVKDHDINQWRHLMGNLNLQHSFINKGQMSVDVDYLLYHHNNPHVYKNTYGYLKENTQELERVNSSKLTPLHLWVGKGDYWKKINESSKIETGIKGSFLRLTNDVLLEKLYQDSWQREAEFSENQKMLEDIGGAYVNFYHSFNNSTSLQTGLRWEYTHTDLSTNKGGNILKRKYHNLFPSVFVSKDLNKNNTLQFSYSRRITRPTYSDLAPVFTFVDPYTTFYGNTSLLPAITNALQGVYQFRKKYMLSLGYSHDANAINAIMRIDREQNKQYTYKENIKSVHTYSLNLNIPLTITSWWNMQNNLMGNWQQNTTEYQGETIGISGYSAQINSTQTLTLPKDFSIEVAGLYKTRSYMGILVRKAYGYVNVGIQKKFKKDKGAMRLSITDLFWNMRYEVVNDLPALNIYQDQGFISEPRVVRLTYLRTFGNENIKVATKRKTGSEEERNRVGN